jgi:Immunoglobulin-like domain of bacterial spore germination/Sporulation and spore germination
MRALIPLGLVLVVVAGCGKSSSHRAAPPATTGSIATTTTTATTTTPPRVPTTVVRVYFLRDGKVAPVAREVPQTQAVAFASLEELFAGPTAVDRADGLATSVPADASPGAVTLVNGVARVDIPQLPRAGLAQVVYTLTQFPTVRGVRTGRSIGDTKPLTRADFEDVTPAILVESPLPHEPVTSPLHVSGTANTFEATFDVRLLDSAGRQLVQKVVTATSGSGMRGTYDVALTFPDTAIPRWLEAYEPSAENGRPLHKVRIPVNG